MQYSVLIYGEHSVVNVRAYCCYIVLIDAYNCLLNQKIAHYSIATYRLCLTTRQRKQREIEKKFEDKRTGRQTTYPNVNLKANGTLFSQCYGLRFSTQCIVYFTSLVVICLPWHYGNSTFHNVRLFALYH